MFLNLKISSKWNLNQNKIQEIGTDHLGLVLLVEWDRIHLKESMFNYILCYVELYIILLTFTWNYLFSFHLKQLMPSHFEVQALEIYWPQALQLYTKMAANILAVMSLAWGTTAMASFSRTNRSYFLKSPLAAANVAAAIVTIRNTLVRNWAASNTGCKYLTVNSLPADMAAAIVAIYTCRH